MHLILPVMRWELFYFKLYSNHRSIFTEKKDNHIYPLCFKYGKIFLCPQLIANKALSFCLRPDLNPALLHPVIGSDSMEGPRAAPRTRITELKIIIIISLPENYRTYCLRWCVRFEAASLAYSSVAMEMAQL